MTPEFSHLIAVDRVPPGGLTERIEAGEDERRSLARRFNLLAIRELAAVLELAPWRRGGIKVTGRFDALVEQTCVVTLEPFETQIAEDITRYFAGQNAPGPTPVVHSVESLGEDEPEVIRGNAIDLGELVAESLGLALDPYPRRPGVEFSSRQVEDGAGAAQNPFAALQSLKSDPKRKR
jgi:uncharacterized metal-binding protein YceD (DUF177 family)